MRRSRSKKIRNKKIFYPESVIIGSDDSEEVIPLRRLTSLTELIEGESTCTAMCLDEGWLKVTANHISQSSESFLKSFLEHVSVIAQFNLSDIEDTTILEESLKRYCKSNEWRNTSLNLILKDEIKQDLVIQNILESSLAPIVQKNLRLKQKFNVDNLNNLSLTKEQTAGITTTIADLVRNYKKLLSYITSSKGQDEEWVRNLAAKKYKIIDNIKILETKKTIHAELRLIDHILKEKTKDITEATYIATSKLCCIDCKSSIVAINKYLNLRDIKGFKILDTHNQDFYSGWAQPEFFAYPNVKEWYKDSKEVPYPKRQMRGEASSSETESFDFIASEYVAKQALLTFEEIHYAGLERKALGEDADGNVV